MNLLESLNEWTTVVDDMGDFEAIAEHKYHRTNHKNLHVPGYKEEGTTTKPFDMVVLNDLNRFHLCKDVIDRLPQLGAPAYFKQSIREKQIDHNHYVRTHGDGMPKIAGWRWRQGRQLGTRGT